MHRVVVTGLGCVTPIGSTIEDVYSSLLSGTTGIGPFDSLPFLPDGVAPFGLRFTQMAQVRDFNPQAHLPSGTIAGSDRTSQFALVAARQAAQHSQFNQHYAPHRMAAVFGCSTGGRISEEAETAKLYTRNARPHPLTVIRTMANAGASHVSIDLGITGPVLTLSTACSSGTHAIGLAFQMVRSGMADAAIAGGHEAPLSYGFLRAWDSMRVVSATQCRPFSADRDGMTLGEGAAMFTLETLASAQARNAPIYAEIVGFGMSADATHITNPASSGAASAMRAALMDAASAPGAPSFESLLEQVGYINAHGTGTQANDSTEAAAIHDLFGPRASTIPISSTKSLHGHSIGATGAIEALITLLALYHGKLPATAGTLVVDPTLNLDVITRAPREATPQLALSNSLAFGGLNAVLALRPYA
ncbi:beta-ketoacyl-[acyl-carrier-protein] synthase family protein [Granulicella sp. dw_53]|uniref:beta-ketoacyl-[acyl-carrier-protein] synthase family protein n=1 Tax=Granulicella sp. dw_53 TaxID=2719792 RepID=UPI001BD5DCB6